MNYIPRTVERERQRAAERSLVPAKPQHRDDEVMHCELQKQYGERGFISGWKTKTRSGRQIQTAGKEDENNSNRKVIGGGKKNALKASKTG